MIGLVFKYRFDLKFIFFMIMLYVWLNKEKLYIYFLLKVKILENNDILSVGYYLEDFNFFILFWEN